MEKQEIKWEEVAHHYSRSKISISNGSEIHDVSELSIYPHGILVEFGRGGFVFTWEEHKPILRDLDDMTGDEIGKLSELQGCKLWKHPPYSISTWTPAAFHWLLAHGFDVFGLIESGQAIRKEVKP